MFEDDIGSDSEIDAGNTTESPVRCALATFKDAHIAIRES